MGAVPLQRTRRQRSYRADFEDGAWEDARWHEVPRRPHLRVVPDEDEPEQHEVAAGPDAGTAGPPSRSRRRRRLAVLAVVAVLTGLLTLLVGDLGADAGAPAPPHGHVVVEPGGTLWEIAVEHAPAGTDPRDYLAQVRDLNGFDGEIPAWTVVLLPGDRRVTSGG